MAITVDGKTVNARTLKITNIIKSDYPDFCDAYFYAAKFEDGTPLNAAQVEALNAEYGDEVNSIIHERALFVF